ncbi:MAG TPA: hypothetical protein VH041_07185 [Caldimonas sp.]|jgi:hypothetical protein|nr:hypothetical protein [Caldimonas sp.]HEX4234074.1 hypothetical protein [Caldimonas sp.]
MTTMTAHAPPTPSFEDAGGRFEVRSITGACYTLIEEIDRKGARSYHTAYALLPVVANDDGSFTLVDTGTRLVRIGNHH